MARPAPSVRARMLSCLAGLVVVLLGVPLVLRLWWPTEAIAAWILAYVLGMAVFMVATTRRGPWTEFVWSCALAILFAAVPLSLLVLPAEPQALWAGGALMTVHIANEIASAKYAARGDWRVPLMILVLPLSIVTGILVSPVLAVAVLAAGVMLARNTQAANVEAGVLRHERAHDPLTGLLNRRGWLDAVEQLGETPLTIVLLDANRFKQINDAHGYEAGDRAIRAAANALHDRLGPTWTVARQGGDEFIAVSKGYRDIPSTLADPIWFALPHREDFVHVDVSLSVGVAHCSGWSTINEGLNSAEFMLQNAKRSGGGIQQTSGPSLHDFGSTLKFHRGPGTAPRGSLFMVAQPMVTTEGQVTHWELLVRWRDPSGRTQTPSEFLTVLARRGLMGQLNDRVIEAGVAFAARFRSAEHRPVISVNLNAAHLADPDLVRYVEELLYHYNVDGQQLMIEITESETLQMNPSTLGVAEGLAALGVGLVIDDFGTGYSSIERMVHLPATHLKLDSSFAAGTEGPLCAVVQGVIEYANAIGVQVIAEGIELQSQHNRMRRLGCDLFQGYLIGRPMSLDKVEAFESASGSGPQAERKFHLSVVGRSELAG